MSTKTIFSYKLFVLVCLASLGTTAAFRIRAQSTDSGDLAPNKTECSVKSWGTECGTWGAEKLLCGLVGNGPASKNVERCHDLCKDAIQNIPQPGFPHDFFGGGSARDRAKGQISFGEGAGALDVDILPDETVIVKSVDETFAYPMDMPAYFTCYTRAKWPVFSSWVVDPELLKGDKKTRHGSFGNPDKDSDAYMSMHANMKDEFLRAGDVKGVWSDYFGFDQGHWAPDAPFRKVAELVASTYYYVNVSPQTSCLNRGNWEGLEASIREFSESKDRLAAVMAGPLDQLPSSFYEDAASQKKWFELLDLWRAASEVLMVNDLEKDPHWLEVVSEQSAPKRCITLEPNSAVLQLDKFSSLSSLPACDLDSVSKNLQDKSVFLMTEAGKTAVRRGVRVPLGYWKAVSWEEGKKHMYCCWFFDQTDAVQNVGSQCKNLVKEHVGSSIIPSSMSYAGDAACNELFNPAPKNYDDDSIECTFQERGVGWRGKFLLDLMGTDGAAPVDTAALLADTPAPPADAEDAADAEDDAEEAEGDAPPNLADQQGDEDTAYTEEQPVDMLTLQVGWVVTNGKRTGAVVAIDDEDGKFGIEGYYSGARRLTPAGWTVVSRGA